MNRIESIVYILLLMFLIKAARKFWKDIDGSKSIRYLKKTTKNKHGDHQMALVTSKQ